MSAGQTGSGGASLLKINNVTPWKKEHDKGLVMILHQSSCIKDFYLLSERFDKLVD